MNGTSRRAWVKNAAIVFLIVLLLLTFFSNTILNYSLPEVSVQYASYDSITEHFAGAFPLWLSPEQVVVIPVSNAFNEYAEKVNAQLEAAGLRVHADLRNEKMGYKIREAQLQKTPYMLIVGEREMLDGTVSVRSRSEGDIGAIAVGAFIDRANEEIRTKKI